MKVRDLMANLRQFPPDMDVVYWSDAENHVVFGVVLGGSILDPKDSLWRIKDRDRELTKPVVQLW